MHARTPDPIQTGSIVVLNYGAEQGAIVGDTLLLTKPRFLLKTRNADPLQYDNRGELLILQVFAEASYAGVLNAKTPVNLLDHVSSP